MYNSANFYKERLNMTTTSLARVQFLNDVIEKSLNSVALPVDNTILAEKLVFFKDKLKNLLALMQKTRPDEMATEYSDYEFFNSLMLNRGESAKRRFFKIDLFTPLSANKQACIEDQISRLTKDLIESLEDDNLCPALLEAFRKNNIHEILYHNAVMGRYVVADKKSEKPYGPEVIEEANTYLKLSGISIALYTSAFFLGLSGGWMIAATVLFSASVAYMAGLLYGMVNDYFATKANLPYFLLGHQASQLSFFMSNDPLVQAIGWGVIATFPLDIIAAIVFAISVAVAMMVSTAPIVTFVLPMLLIITPLLAVAANVYANYCVKGYMEKGISLWLIPENIASAFRKAVNLPADAKRIDLDKIDFDSEELRDVITQIGLLNEYQLDGLALMSNSKKDIANWLANSDRNTFGYAAAPITAVTGLILMLSLSESVPALFLTPLFATIIPVAVSVVAITLLAVALNYAANNADKQVDNRYKLFSKSALTKMDELYVTEDLGQGLGV